jgi:putative transposase
MFTVGRYGRLGNKRPEILTPKIKQKILSIWYARRAAGSKAIWKEVKQWCKEEDLSYPGYESVKKFLAGQSEQDKLVRAGKIDVWEKQGRPVVTIINTLYSNERWQIDHSRLDIWVREFIDGEWKPSEVWITTVLDVHSRSIAGFVLSTKVPDAWTNAILLRHAVRPKANKKWRNRGLPSILQPDRGKDFLSHSVGSSLAYLGIRLDPDPPYYPNRKGKIERWFRTLDNGCLRLLPGHMKATTVRAKVAKRYVSTLLTRRQLLREIEAWIVEVYHHTVHSETNRKPAELWEETVRLRVPESDDALDNFLLKSDVVRTIQSKGVQFHIPGNEDLNTRGGYYWSPELTHHWKRQVRIRYNPEDLQSILLYCAATGEYLCEAWLMGEKNSKYGIEDVKRNRNQYHRGLIERQGEYAEEVYELDRRKARQAEWEQAREDADDIAAEVADFGSQDDDQDSVETLLDLLDEDDMEEGVIA